MYCEAGAVKIRLAARAVPDLDPGPLAREHSQQPATGSSPPRQNSLLLKGYQAMVYKALPEFTGNPHISVDQATCQQAHRQCNKDYSKDTLQPDHVALKVSQPAWIGK